MKDVHFVILCQSCRPKAPIEELLAAIVEAHCSQCGKTGSSPELAKFHRLAVQKAKLHELAERQPEGASGIARDVVRGALAQRVIEAATGSNFVDCQRCGAMIAKNFWNEHLAAHERGELPTLPVAEAVTLNALARLIVPALLHEDIVASVTAWPAPCDRCGGMIVSPDDEFHRPPPGQRAPCQGVS